MNKNFIKVTLLFLLTMCLVFQTQAAPGDLDLTFGTGGKVITDFGGLDRGTAAALQSDGKIVVVGQAFATNANGNFDNFAVARYNPDGTLDTSFDGDGKVITPIGRGLSRAYSVAIQPDGKILVVGEGYNTNTDFAIARYNSDGSLDTSFNNDGRILISASKDPAPNASETAREVLIQPDGKIIVVGDTVGYGLAVVRLNLNGSLDTSFGESGLKNIQYFRSSVLTYSVFASSAVLLSGGKILIGGYINVSPSFDFGLVRLNSDGSLDGSFGNNYFDPNDQRNHGFTVTPIGDRSNDVITDLAIQNDGKIVAVGMVTEIFSGRPSDFVVTRFNTNGTFDTSFGNNGVVYTTFITQGSNGNEAHSVTIQPDNKIIVGGIADISPDTGFRDAFALVRYIPDGSLDNSFGTGGKVTTEFPITFGSTTTRAFESLNDLLLSDGKIVAAGTSQFDFALARYETTSSKTKYDFDGDGKADISVFRPSNGAWYLNQSQNGFTGVQFGASTDKLVPADYDGDGKTDVAVYRSGVWYLNRSQLGFTGFAFGDANDIPQPADFDGDGKAELAVFRPSNGTWYVFNLANNQFNAVQFGASTDKPVVGDYDGDGKADYAVYRSGVWYIQRSQLGFTGIAFGDAQDKPVPADYDGDNKADIAVFRPSNGVWYLQRSRDGFIGIQFGVSTDLPTPADYDGDGKADVAVFRAGTWYLQRSTAGFTGVAFGAATDKPVQNAFVP